MQAKVSSPIPQWFDITKYERAKDFGVMEWASHLLARFEWYQWSYGPHAQPGVFSKVFRQRMTPLLRIDPLSEKVGALVGALKTVRPLTARDVILLQSAPAVKALGEMTPIQRAWFSGGYDPVDHERQFPVLKIDVFASREEITSHFITWLKGYQLGLPSRPKVEGFTCKDFEKWHIRHVLPYLDLNLWGKSEGIQIKDKDYVEAIYVDDIDANGSEDLKDHTKPLAKDLMRRERLEALVLQASRKKGFAA